MRSQTDLGAVSQDNFILIHLDSLLRTSTKWPDITGSVSYLVCVCLSSENFLHFKGNAPPSRLVTVLAFLLELLRRNNDSDPALLTMPLPSLLHCLKLVNEPHGESPHTERHVHTVIIFVNNMPNKLAAMGVFSRFFVCAICVW